MVEFVILFICGICVCKVKGGGGVCRLVCVSLYV